MKHKVALLSGVTGQDGSYLAELLISKGYEVHGIIRRCSTSNTSRIADMNIQLHFSDLTETANLVDLMYTLNPDEIYALGAQSHVKVSFDIPEYTADVTGVGTLRLLEAMRKACPNARLYQAGSCLPAGTKILVRKEIERGSQKFMTLGTTVIENIKIGDEVLSFNLETSKKEYCKVLKTGDRIANDMYSIKFSNNNELRLSGNHPIYVIGKGWVRADCIKLGDEVIQKKYNGLRCRCMKGKSNTELYGSEKTKSIYKKSSDAQKNRTWEHPWKGKCLKEYDPVQYDHMLSYSLFFNGGIPSWNTGLTKDTDIRLQQCADKISVTQKKLWSDPEYAKKMTKAFRMKFNKQEQKLFGILNEITPNEFIYNGDASILTIGTKIPDFVCEKRKKLIEFNGDYWHRNDVPGERINFFKKHGWETLEIWQSELSKHPLETKKKIQTFLYNPAVDLVKVVEITTKPKEKVYDIEVETHHNFFANGILVHNSEQFGSALPPQNELTRFQPESPYACAKIFAYNMVHVYRKSYGIFATNGLLFNHETISSFMPMIYKIDDTHIDIKPISEICRNVAGVNIDENENKYQSGTPLKDVEIWDKNGWTKMKYVSGYPHNTIDDNKLPRIVNARNSVVMATSSHVFFDDDENEIKCGDLNIGNKVYNINLPEATLDISLNSDICFLLGALVGDGYINERGDITYISKNIDEIKIIESIWTSLDVKNSVRIDLGKSGFTGIKNIYHIHLKGNKKIINQFDLYNEDDTKRVPHEIFNSTKENMIAFLNGYNMADGMKSNPCIYLYKNFKTNSATLAQGLVYLISQTTKQKINITVEETDKWGYKTFYYSINLLSNSKFSVNNFDDRIDHVLCLLKENESQRNIARITGLSRGLIRKIKEGYKPPKNHHLQKPANEIKKIIEYPDYDGWFYDIETESGTFHCGVGYGYVHNSERRGDNFVTRKITRAATRIKLGLQDKLKLGNIDSYRDWGHAKDYVRAMWMMLQHTEPEDFVVCSGESHSVREFLEITFDKLGLDPYKYVEIDKSLFRPSEVDHLRGDYSKIKNILGWEPEISFDGLVSLMIEHDLELAKNESKFIGG